MADSRVDVVYEFVGAEGWRVDAYIHGTSDPVGGTEAIAGLRFALAEHVHRWARKTYGARLVTCTRNHADRSLL